MTAASRRLQTLLASVLLALGLILAALMIATESEPGAIPLLLVVAGATWLAVVRRRRPRD